MTNSVGACLRRFIQRVRGVLLWVSVLRRALSGSGKPAAADAWGSEAGHARRALSQMRVLCFAVMKIGGWHSASCAIHSSLQLQFVELCVGAHALHLFGPRCIDSSEGQIRNFDTGSPNVSTLLLQVAAGGAAKIKMKRDFVLPMKGAGGGICALLRSVRPVRMRTFGLLPTFSHSPRPPSVPALQSTDFVIFGRLIAGFTQACAP